MTQPTDPNDLTLNCRDCKQSFIYTAGEQKFFAERGLTSPSRCKACRQIRKAAKDAESAGGGYNKAGGYTAAAPPVEGGGSYGAPLPEEGGRGGRGGRSRDE